MRQLDIHENAKQELEDIINDLFIAKVDWKINEKISELSTKIEDRSNGMSSKIDTVSRSIIAIKEEITDIIEGDIGDRLEGLKAESETQNRELRRTTSENFELLQNKLSEIQNKDLAEILSKAIIVLENQKKYSEDFVLELDGAIKSHTQNIVSNHSENRELLEKSQFALQSEVLDLINGNGSNQKKDLQILGRSISDFVELENQNKSNLQKQLELEFQKLERLKSDLIRDFEEKTELLKIENEKQVSEVVRKSSKGFISLLILNLLILGFLLLKHFLVIGS